MTQNKIMNRQEFIDKLNSYGYLYFNGLLSLEPKIRIPRDSNFTIPKELKLYVGKTRRKDYDNKLCNLFFFLFKYYQKSFYRFDDFQESKIVNNNLLKKLQEYYKNNDITNNQKHIIDLLINEDQIGTLNLKRFRCFVSLFFLIIHSTHKNLHGQGFDFRCFYLNLYNVNLIKISSYRENDLILNDSHQQLFVTLQKQLFEKISFSLCNIFLAFVLNLDCIYLPEDFEF